MASLLGGFAGVGGGNIGRAVVDLVLNTGVYGEQLAAAEGETTAATSKMGKGFSGFQQQVKSSFTGAQTAVVAFGAIAAVAIGKSVSATQEWASEVRSLQRVTGQTAESASALAGAGQQLGIDVNSLNTGFGLLAKNIVNSSANLEKYGVATKDAEGNVLPFDQVLANVSDKFAALPAGPEQAAFAMNVFGRSGKALIPILSQGSAGLAELEAHAKAAGLVMSQDDLNASKALSIATRQMSEAFKGAEVQLGKAFVPVLTAMAKGLTAAVEVLNVIPGPVKSVLAAVAALTAVVIVAQKAWAILGTNISITGKEAGASIPVLGELAAVAVELGQGSQANAMNQEVLNGLLEDAKTKYADGTISLEEYNRIQGEVTLANLKAGDITKKQIVGYTELGRTLAIQNGYLDASAGSEAQLTSATADATAAAKAHAQALQAEWAASIKGAGGILGLVDSLEQLKADQKAVNDLQSKGKTNTQAYRDAVQAVIADQLAFRQAQQGVVQDLRQGNITLEEAKRKLLEMGLQAGLTKNQIKDATTQSGLLKAALDGLHDKKINVTVDITPSIRSADLAGAVNHMVSVALARYGS